jgi:hypothetical protein
MGPQHAAPWMASSQGLAMTVSGGVRVPQVDFLISGLRLRARVEITALIEIENAELFGCESKLARLDCYLPSPWHQSRDVMHVFRKGATINPDLSG